MRRFADDDEVDLVIVGCGAGGCDPDCSGWPAPAGGSSRLDAGPFWDPDTRLGQRRGRLAPPVLDRAAGRSAAPTRSRSGSNNSGRGVGGSMVHYAGYTPRFHPSRLPHATAATASARTGRSPTPTCGRTTRRSRQELPVAGQDWPWGDPHAYPHRAAPGRRQRRDLPARRRRRRASRPGSGRSRSPTAGSATGRTASTAASACRAARSTPRPRPLITHIPDALAHGAEIRADSHGHPRRGRRRAPAGPPACTTCATACEHFQRARAGRRRRVLDRDAAAAAQLGLRPLPGRAVQRLRPGRPLPDGAGRAADRGPLRRRGPDVQGAAARGQQRAVLRDRPDQALPARLLHPDRLARCRSPGPSTSPPRATGARRCASTCATTCTGPCLGALCEFLPQPDNRVTLADEKDRHGLPVAHFSYSPVRQRPAAR